MRAKPETASGFAQNPPSSPRGTKKSRWLWGLGLGAGLLTASYFLFQNLVVNAQLRPVIERELAKAVHSKVSIGSLRGGIMGNVVLRQVVLTVPGSPWETHLTVERISVNVELFNLLFHRKPLENCFESLSFFRPKLLLVKTEPPPPPPGPVTATLSAGTTEVKVPLALLPVPKIFVSQGSFSIQAEKTPREMLTNMNFDASTENGATWGLAFQAHSPEAGSLGTLRFNGSLELAAIKISGKVLLEKWPLASLHSVLKELAGWELESGTIDAESPLVFQPGHGLWFDAKTNLAQATLKSPAPTSITLSQISGRAFIRPTEINVPGEIRFQLGETAWRASGLIPFDGRQLAVRTTTDELFLSSVFSEILKLKTWKVDGKGSATLVASGTLANPVMQGDADLGPSHVGKWPLDSLSVKAGYENGSFKLLEAGGKLFSGDFQANGFMSLSGSMDAPVSLKALLKNIDAKKLAATLGISGMEGRGDVESFVSGTLEKPLLTAKSQWTLTRTLRNVQVNYSVAANLQRVEQKTTLSAVIDGKARLDAEVLERPDQWDLRKFSFSTSKKSGKLTGQGTWPKDENQNINALISGNDITIQDIPFFNDQFPGILSQVKMEIHVAGTPKAPHTVLLCSSPEVVLPGLEEPVPMEVALDWSGDDLNFKTCKFGELFSASGKLGLGRESPTNLTMDSKGFPINLIAAITRWDNPPQPFEGLFTGQAHLTGLLRNPIIEGNGKIESLKVGDWEADQVEALIAQEQEKLQIKKLKITQGPHALTATGSWDRKSVPGVMSLRISAREFQLGKGPFLSGDFLWQAKTGDAFLDDWNGFFTSDSIAIKDLKSNIYHFNNFSMAASSLNRVVKGKIEIGKAITGSAVFDWSADPLTLEAMLKIEPVSLAEAPEISQFIPDSLKTTGKISGQLQLKKGSLGQLPMEGTFSVTNGMIRTYNFDSLEFTNNGNKGKVALRLSLARGEAKYSLAGTLESPKAFWDSDSKITINGPFQKEKLKNLLGLLGINTEKHVVAGQVDGNLSVTGSFADPSVGFSATGENLQYDNNRVPSAELHFSASKGKILLEKNRISLEKGQINIERGSAQFDPNDSTVAVLNLSGSTQNVPIAVLNFTSQIKLNGRLALEDKPERPTFDGILSILQTNQGEKTSSSFDLAIQVHKKVIEFKAMPNDKTQLVGLVDISQTNKVVFQNIHLEHSLGSFSVDGNLDLNGTSHFISDAKNIPIEAVGKWFLPNFPLSGIGSYHLIFDGTLDSPIFSTSLTVAGGKVGDLEFDLLDGQLKSSESHLMIGTKEAPLTLSRKGLFSFDLWGKVPIAFTKTGWLKVHNQEMDINAEMDKGDFGLILLGGLAKKASGEMDFSAHVGGTLDDPVLKMDLDISKASMVPYGYAHSVDDINGRIKVRDNKLVIEDLNGRVGQGRIFITSPPIEQTKMVLQDFIPQYLDLSVRTVGDKGLYLHIDGIMDETEWGEIQFYGATKEDALQIVGPLEAPKVIGTAFLQSGHYTFPPKEKNGKTVTYNALGNVTFDLNLVSGNNAWYSNDFAGQYLELKIDPGDQLKITGKDSDKTPDAPGINCLGGAGSKEGWLRYLGHEFKMQQASIFMVKGKAPFMRGHATDRLLNVDVVSPGGTRKADVDIWVDFKGNFGSIEFTLDSSPRFGANDPDGSQKILLSYIMFGQDMTGLTNGNKSNYTPEELQAAYQQKFGQIAGQAALDAIFRIGSNKVTTFVRPLGQAIGGLDVDVQLGSGLVGSGSNAGTETGPSVDPSGNTLAGGKIPALSFRLRKSLDPKLSVLTNFGLNRDIYSDKTGTQAQVGIQYDISKSLSLNALTGSRASDSQQETSIMAQINQPLPDIISPKKGDREKPKFIQFETTPMGFGKLRVVWETDKVTKSEIRIFDTDDKLVQDIKENNDYVYDHLRVVENLNPNSEYKIQISVKDPNGNERIQEQKITPANE